MRSNQILQMYDFIKKKSAEKEFLTNKDIADGITNIRNDNIDTKKIYENKNVSKNTIKSVVEEIMEYEEAIDNRKTIFVNDKDKTVLNITYQNPLSKEDMYVINDLIIGAKWIDLDNKKRLMKVLEKELFYRNDFGYDLTYFEKKTKVPYDELMNRMLLVREAIQNHRKISFDYHSFYLDKGKLKTKFEETKIMSPYLLLLKNDQYYMVAVYNTGYKTYHYRLELMQNIVVLDEEARPMKEVNIDTTLELAPNEYSDQHAMMYSDKRERIEVKIDKDILIYLLDTFVDNKIIELGEDKDTYTLSLLANKKEFGNWAVQFCDRCEVIDPKDLVDNVSKRLSNAVEKYSKEIEKAEKLTSI